jgi:hypothetical protein
MLTNKKLIRSIVVTMGIMFTFAVTSAFTATENLIGAVVTTNQGTALSTDGGEYLFLGNDLSAMTGKTLDVTGYVENGVLANTIWVKSFKVLSNEDLIDPSPHGAGPARS